MRADEARAARHQNPAVMGDHDGMTEGFHAPLRHVHHSEISAETSQSSGMARFVAISGKTVGAQRLWMGQTHVAASTRSADHHHGEAETAIFVLSGSPEFVFLDPATGQQRRIRTAPGDYVFVPPYTPHREENNDPDNEAVVVG